MTPTAEGTGRAPIAPGRSRTPPRPRAATDAAPYAAPDAVPDTAPDAAPDEAPRYPPFAVRSYVANGRGGRTTVVTVSGELDVAVAEPVGRALAYAFDHVGPRIVLDMADVAFADTSGLAAVGAFGRRTRECGGRVALVGAAPLVVRLLEATGQRLTTYLTVAEALHGPAPA